MFLFWTTTSPIDTPLSFYLSPTRTMFLVFWFFNSPVGSIPVHLLGTARAGREGGGWTTTSHYGLFLLRGLRSFGVQVVLQRSFCGGTGCLVWSWTGSISARDKKRLDRLIRKATSFQGCLLDRGDGRQPVCHPWWRREAFGSFTDRRLEPTCGKNYI